MNFRSLRFLQKIPNVGCLVLLVLWALCGVAMQLTGKWHSSGPGDDEGGGVFAIIGVIGVIAYLMTCALSFARHSIAQRLQHRVASPPPTSEENR